MTAFSARFSRRADTMTDALRHPPIPPCAALCDAVEARRGVSRRTFVSAATMATVAAMLEACGASGATGLRSGGGPITVTLSNFSALAAVGGIARVDGGSGSPTALVRTGTSTFVALTMVCTHEGTTIGISGSGFLCPNHGARFTATGVWQGGQSTSNLGSYGTTFDATAGTVTIARPS
jgi:cytochrome b6-f complex iron-sulfur subunit